MDSRFSFLLVLFCLAMLFNASLCFANGGSMPPGEKVVKKGVMKRWERDLREFAATKRQLCDLAERMDCPPLTR